MNRNHLATSYLKDSEKPSVLIVDDDEKNLLAYEAVLSGEDCELVMARSGLEAIEEIQKKEFAAVLLDIQMPGMNGFETAKRIRNLANAKLLPILFVTAGSHEVSQVLKAYEAGGIDYLEKPIEPIILRAKVKLYIELYQGRLLKQKAADEALVKVRDTEADLKLKSNALENSLAGFDIVDESGRFIYVNPAYVKMWGFDSAEEVIGTSPASHCEDPNVPVQIIQSLKENGSCDIEFVAKRKDGSTFDVRMLAFLAYDVNGREIYPTTSVDITEQKKARENMEKYAEELMAAKVEAEKANQLKSNFLANMSHEIRTPLGAMIGFADLLRDPYLSKEEHSNYLDIMIRNGEQLSFIINDILDLSKVEAGYLKLDRLPTKPVQIAEEVLSLLQVKAQEKNLLVEFEADPSTPVQIISDPIRVRQVLLNLVSNAIKFTSQGKVSFKCFGVKDLSGQNRIAFEVSDTGIGIPPGEEEKIFEMFVQGDGSVTRRFGGTGLGLSLSRKLARELGGDVKVTSSKLDQGSTFLFTFSDLSAATAGADQKMDLKKTDSQSKIENSLKGYQILVVDDIPDNRNLLRLYLSKAGAQIELAENGVDGFEKASHGHHDLVLMDIQMPVMDGYTATQKLREQGYQKPIIALTAHAMAEVRNKCLRVGYTDHLSKPIDIYSLVQKIRLHSGKAAH